MADSVVAPVADPIIDTVYDLELQVLGTAEGLVDQTDIKPVTDSAFSLARSIFEVQRDLSRKLIDAVDQTIASVSSAVDGAVSDGAKGSAKTKSGAKAPLKSA